MKKVLMIINPSAGKLKSKTALFDMIFEFCKADCQVITQITQYKGHATDIAKAAKIRKTDQKSVGQAPIETTNKLL